MGEKPALENSGTERRFSESTTSSSRSRDLISSIWLDISASVFTELLAEPTSMAARV